MKKIAPIWLVVLAPLLVVSSSTAAEPVSFMKDVAPILLRRCAGCHGDKKAEGGYRLHTFVYLLESGDSGEIPVDAEEADRSLLLQRIIEMDETIRMPQKDDPLSDGEVALIKTWIQQGARFDGKDRAQRLVTQLPPREHPSGPEEYRVPVPVQTIASHPNQDLVAISGYHEVLVWDLTASKVVKRIQHLPQRIQSIVWTDSGRELVVAGGTPGEYGELCLVDFASGSRKRVFGTFDDIVLCCALDADSKRVAVGTAAKESRVYNFETGELIWQARSHSGWVTGVTFSSDGKYVITTSRDKTAKVHSAVDGTLFTIYNGHRLQLGGQSGRFAINDIRVDAATGLLFSAGEGKAIRIWDPTKAKSENGTAADMEGRFFKMGHTRFISHNMNDQVLAIRIHGGHIAVAGASGQIKVLQISDGQEIASFEGPKDWVFSVEFTADGSKIISGDFSGDIRIWDLKEKKPAGQFLAKPNK